MRPSGMPVHAETVSAIAWAVDARMHERVFALQVASSWLSAACSCLAQRALRVRTAARPRGSVRGTAAAALRFLARQFPRHERRHFSAPASAAAVGLPAGPAGRYPAHEFAALAANGLRVSPGLLVRCHCCPSRPVRLRGSRRCRIAFRISVTPSCSMRRRQSSIAGGVDGLAQADPGAGRVEQADRLVGQLPSRDVAAGEPDGVIDRLVEDRARRGASPAWRPGRASFRWPLFSSGSSTLTT